MKGKMKKGFAKSSASEKGGAGSDLVVEKKKSIKVSGGSAAKRLDKRARGGKISTPSSPTSGAMPGGLPGGGKMQTKPDKENN